MSHVEIFTYILASKDFKEKHYINIYYYYIMLNTIHKQVIHRKRKIDKLNNYEQIQIKKIKV